MEVGVAGVARLDRAALFRLSEQAASSHRLRMNRDLHAPVPSGHVAGRVLAEGSTRFHGDLTVPRQFPGRAGIIHVQSSLMEGVCP
jgi:hypothetical protein